MKRNKIRLNSPIILIYVLLSVVSCSVSVSQTPHTQDAPVLSLLSAVQSNAVRATSTFKQNGKIYTAYLYETFGTETTTCKLVITGQSRNEKPLTMFTEVAEGCDWERLVSLNGGSLQGFVLWMDHPDYWFGKTRVIVLNNGKFKRAYESNFSSEVVDINGDGFPEMIDSRWPDGDGRPQSSAIYIWNGDTYILLMRVPWVDRLGSKVLKAVSEGTKPYRKRYHING